VASTDAKPKVAEFVRVHAMTVVDDLNSVVTEDDFAGGRVRVVGILHQLSQSDVGPPNQALPKSRLGPAHRHWLASAGHA
jgi:hypothetical protein